MHTNICSKTFALELTFGCQRDSPECLQTVHEREEKNEQMGCFEAISGIEQSQSSMSICSV